MEKIIKKKLSKKELQLEEEYLKTLEHDDEAHYKSLSLDEKRTILKNFKTETKDKGSSKEDNLINFFEKHGIYSPSNTLISAANKNNISTFSSKLGNTAGLLTMNLEKQMNFKFHMSQLNQNFVNTALLNKIVNQNEEIIELLKTIANK